MCVWLNNEPVGSKGDSIGFFFLKEPIILIVGKEKTKSQP